jgi:hypothetical protein
LATVAEGKIKKRAAIPKMVNNSLLSRYTARTTDKRQIEIKEQNLCKVKEY